MQLKTQIFSILLFFSLGSCVDFADLSDAQVPDYEAEFAVPLINSRLTIKDMIDSNTPIDGLSIASDGTLRFQYFGTEVRREGEAVFEDLTANFPRIFTLPAREIRFPLSLVSNVELDRLDFKTGQFVYTLENPNEESILVEFELSTLFNDETPFRFTVEVPAYSGSGPLPRVTNSGSPIDLKDYQLIPNDNRIELRYSAINENGEQRPLEDFVVEIVDPVFSYAEGYLGQFVIEGVEDSVVIDFVEEYSEGNIQFATPTAVLLVENSFGVAMEAEVNELIVLNTDNTEQEFRSSLLDEGLLFPYPEMDQVGTVLNGAFTFDKDNSNIVDLFSNNPLSTIYDIDALVNPEADEDLLGFMTDSSYLSLQVRVDLPLFGTANDYFIRDTFDIDLVDFDEIEQATFKMITENELGIDASVQAYFLDDQGAVLETLFTDQQLIAKGANVNEDGLSDAPAVTTTFVETDAVRSQRIRQASQLALQVGFSTETNDPRPVRILEQQGIRLKMGAVVRVRSNQ
ncbi:MAG TPA: hypothetical protein VJ953_01700 [Saprospiraceae bacterium]|nr:hypothetical protein [Saprospiraceae bacterium]